MRKRISITLSCIVSVFASGASQSSQARKEPIGTDGCVVLGQIVYLQLASAGNLGGASARVSHEMQPSNAITCDRTARSATMGYSKALSTLNVFVVWQSPGTQAGDFCHSGDLSQCYPEQNQLAPFGTANAKFIRDSWDAVRNTLLATMPTGSATDVSLFSESNLDRQLGNKLSRHGVGGWHAYQSAWSGSQ